MRRIALDTNRYTDLMAQVPEVVAFVATRESVAIPLPVLGEIRLGHLNGKRAKENGDTLDRFLSDPHRYVLLPTRQTAELYAMLELQLRFQGTPLPANDVWIAALCVENGLPLYTRDSHFDKLPQVLRV